MPQICLLTGSLVELGQSLLGEISGNTAASARTEQGSVIVDLVIPLSKSN